MLLKASRSGSVAFFCEADLERRLIVHFIDLERQKLKNIEGEVHAFGIDPDPARLTAETFEVLTGERLEIPEQPSIAVLPLDNMSGDAKQDLFADGLTEDIITALSHIGGLFVMARNSTFVCKGRSVDVRQVGLDAGRWPLGRGLGSWRMQGALLLKHAL